MPMELRTVVICGKCGTRAPGSLRLDLKQVSRNGSMSGALLDEPREWFFDLIDFDVYCSRSCLDSANRKAV